MDTFKYRDARQDKLTQVIAALPAAHMDLLGVLTDEQKSLTTNDWTVTDASFTAVATDFVWKNFTAIDVLVNKDPVQVATDSAPVITAAQLAAIGAVSMPHNALPPPDYLNQILGAVDNDQEIFEEIVLAAHQAWLSAGIENASYPYDDVAVLMPVRLETLFDAPASPLNDDPVKWKLSIRVIPDEASVCRQNAFISRDEGKSLISFWEAIQQPGNPNKSWLETPEADIAWKKLSTHIRPERAAWLVSAIDIKINPDKIDLVLPNDMPPEPELNRIAGFPPELNIFAVTPTPVNGADHFPVGRLPMDPDTTINMANLVLPLSSDLKKQKDSWWASWEIAKAVGLGGEYLLPEGITPDNIDALYVVGIGEEKPEKLFTDQINSGELTLPRLGDATNTVHGNNTGTSVDWQKTAATRLDMRLNPAPVSENAGSRIQQHLTGAADSLPFFPGSDKPDDTLMSQQLAQALWPSLWGVWSRDIWNLGNSAFRRGNWAMENLYPEGPLMPMRISDQPYGLLPVSSLALWKMPEALDPETAAQQQVEANMIRTLDKIRRRMSNLVGGTRSVVGKTSSEFMALLAQDADSSHFLSRNFISFSTLMSLYALDAAGLQQFRDISLSAYKPAIGLMGNEPQDFYLANSYAEYVHLPLVQSTHSLYRHQNKQNRSPLDLKTLITVLIHFFERDGIDQYDLESVFNKFHILEQQSEFQFGSLPDSLLIRLLVNAIQIATVWFHQDPGNAVLKNLYDTIQKQALAIADAIDQKPWVRKDTDPATNMPVFQSVIPDDIRKLWERAFCATLDTAANRIDPWVTGFAWQRLRENSNSVRHNHRLGIYGWVDGPFKGQPGPTDSGLLHTPSYNQTLAALIMRDKFLSTTRGSVVNERGQNLWQMNITSEKVRLSEEIADEVRLGFHIYEVLGRRVENIVGKPIKIRALRASPKYAMHDDRKDENEVCDGLKALPALLSGDPDFPMDADQLKALQLLQDSLDTYSDLLTGDGILQLINRQTDRAAETMDAAAGFSRPPAFDIIKTPPSGYQLETTVLSVLPFVSLDDLADETHPIRLADPSVAGFLENKLGDSWKWTAVNEDDDSVIGTATLVSLQLSVLDTLAISDDLIRELTRYKLGLPLVFITAKGNRQWEAFDNAGLSLGLASISELNLDPDSLPETDILNSQIRTKLGVPSDSVIRETAPADLQLWVAKDENQKLLGLADKKNLVSIPADPEALNKKIRQFLNLAKLRIDAPREHQLAQQLLASLGSRPAAGRDFTDDKTKPAAPDTNIYGELADRYTAVYNTCTLLVDKLNTAVTEADQITALREAIPWGIVPITNPADRDSWMAAVSGLAIPPTSTPLTTLTKNVADSLQARIDAAVKPADLVSKTKISEPLENHQDLKEANKPDGVPSLAKAIANLASPNAKLVILACWDKTNIVDNTGLVLANAEKIEEDWLTIIAAVRANLARLEALQLEMDEPLISWTNSPGDPWRTGDDNIVQQNLKTRKTKSVSNLNMSRFVAAYGTSATWQSTKIAVGLIDTFSEAVPMPQRKTFAAFGFNAPAARAPQAILLAVPPQPRQRLDTGILLTILEETRELAHARTAKMEDTGDLQSLLPTMWLQGSGVTRVRLEPWPLFTD